MVNCDKNSEFAKNPDYICDYDTGNWIKKKPCNENNPKANDGEHVCNEKTGYWVKKDGKIGLKILLEKQQHSSSSKSPKSKSKSPPPKLHKSKSPSPKQSKVCGLNVPGLKVINIPGDGNCFYNAIATALGTTVETIREAFASKVTQEFIDDVNATKENKYTIDSYKKILLTNGKWVPDSAIPLFPKLYSNVGLIILNNSGGGKECTVTCYETLLEKKGKYIILLYSGGAHYDLITINSKEIVDKKDLPPVIVDKIKECKGVQFSVSQVKSPTITKKSRIDIKINGNIVDVGVYDKFSNLVDDYGYAFTDTYKGIYEIKNINNDWSKFLKQAKKVLGKYYNGAQFVDGKIIKDIAVGTAEIQAKDVALKIDTSFVEFKFNKNVPKAFEELINDGKYKYEIGEKDAKLFISSKQLNFNFIEDIKTKFDKCLISIVYYGKASKKTGANGKIMTLYENSKLMLKSPKSDSDDDKPIVFPKKTKLPPKVASIKPKSPPKVSIKPKSPSKIASIKPKSPSKIASIKPKSLPKTITVVSFQGANNVKGKLLKSLQTKFKNVQHVQTKVDYDKKFSKGYAYKYTFEISNLPSNYQELVAQLPFNFTIVGEETTSGTDTVQKDPKDVNDFSKFKDMGIDITKSFLLLISCNPNDEQAIKDFINTSKYKYVMNYMKNTKIVDGKLYFVIQPYHKYNEVSTLSYELNKAGIKTYVKTYNICNPNDVKATKINPKTGKNEYACNYDTGNWVKVGGEAHTWFLKKFNKASPEAVKMLDVSEIPDTVFVEYLLIPGQTPESLMETVKKNAKYTVSKDKETNYSLVIKFSNLDGGISTLLNKKDDNIMKITSTKGGVNTIMYEKPKNTSNTILELMFKDTDKDIIISDVKQLTKEFGYKLVNTTNTVGNIIFSITDTDYKCKMYMQNLKDIFKDALVKMSWGDKVVYEYGKIDMSKFNNSSVQDKLAFIKTNFDNMTEQDKCNIALPFLTNNYPNELKPLTQKIVELGTKLHSTCGVMLHYMDPKYMTTHFFTKFLQNARDAYFQVHFKTLQNAFLYLRYVTRDVFSTSVFEYLYKTYPNSPFMFVEWTNMMIDKFKQELNPYVQMGYLKKHQDKAKEGKWSDMLDSIIARFKTTDLYKELENLVPPEFEETPEIKECMKKYTKAQLVALLVEKFGGTSNNYKYLSHQVLCDMLSKKKLQIIPPEPKTPNVVPIAVHLTQEYKNAFAKQIAYVNSLDYETKVALKRYTYQWDWKVNQVLMQPADKPTSIVHPNYGYTALQKELPEKMEYGYEHVPYNKISDIHKKIDNAFRNVPPIEQDMILYRGINDKGNTTGTYTLKEDFTKQYWSTSITKTVAVGFKAGAKCCLFTIKVPKGTHILPLATLSKYPHENELLLSRNGDYVITKQDGKGNVNMVFYENKDLHKKQVPTPLYNEYITSLQVRMSGPKYIKDIVGSYMGKPTLYGNDFGWNYNTWAHVQYSVPKLPYLLTNKKLTAEYPGVEFRYTIVTNKGTHNLVIKDGHVYESNKIIKPTYAKPILAKNPIYVSPPGGTVKVQGVHINEMGKSKAPEVQPKTVAKPKTGYSIIKGEYNPGEKQYTKIRVITVQKANNLKGKIVIYLEKYFPGLEVKSTNVEKNSQGTYNYIFTIYKPFTNFKEILEQYNKTTPGFAVKLHKKYAATK
jgi:hypothetical protein